MSAPGAKGTVVAYAPLQPPIAGCDTNCLAQVQGPVFNANATNLVSGLSLANGGGFTQYQTPGPCTRAPGLGPAAATYTCTGTLPSAITSISKPLPTTKPPLAANQAGTAVPPSGLCTTGYTYFTPGEYTQEIDFSPHRTYFFESGVYVFDGNNPGFGPFDNLSNPPAANDLYVIGGKPSPGDVATFVGPDAGSAGSPCWSTIKANNRGMERRIRHRRRVDHGEEHLARRAHGQPRALHARRRGALGRGAGTLRT